MLAGLRTKISQLDYKTKDRTLSVLIIIILIVGLLILGLTTSSSSQNKKYTDYEQFIKNYTKRYTAQEEVFRKFVFYQTHDDIFDNKQLDQSYYEGVNQFADLGQAQFRQLFLIVTSVAKQNKFLEIAQFQKKYYYNWTEYMPSVKNMKDYDGSHIFSVVSLMEFQVNKLIYLQYKQKGQNLQQRNWVTLSQQQVIDCCQNCTQMKYKNPYYVYRHLIQYGISIDKKYPYTSSIYQSQPKNCQTRQSKKQFKIKDFENVNSCVQLSKRLELSPVVVSVDARTWRNYAGGIHDKCSTVKKRNHYALVVGRGINYWIIRNSWGKRWGERGHIRIKSGDHCGVCTKGSYIIMQ